MKANITVAGINNQKFTTATTSTTPSSASPICNIKQKLKLNTMQVGHLVTSLALVLHMNTIML
jgi:hypothetical protein